MTNHIACLHPTTRKLQSAEVLPDHYGPGKDGLRFSTGMVYRAEKVLKFEEPGSVALTEMQVKLGTTG
jgi:hypothetical protein